jgi:thymidylate synthase (FAD)
VREVHPSIRIVGRPQVDVSQLQSYLEEVGGESWLERVEPIYGGGQYDGEALTEFAGRLCYRSWQPGLNPNVTKVREDVGEYFDNVLQSGHGSVTEHAFYIFVFHNVSRVFTHELVRHRAGVSISQESLRYVRLTDLPIWTPEWARQDAELMERNRALWQHMEEHQTWMAEHFQLDATIACPDCDGEGGMPGWEVCMGCEGRKVVPAVGFGRKKAMTSYMRRHAPIGLATSMVWGANIRTLRHVLTMRTDEAAEEEIRLVFDAVGRIMQAEAPHLFGDFTVTDTGMWVPGGEKDEPDKYRKV